MALLGYARVSTRLQSLELQIERLKAEGVREDRIFTDTQTGKHRDREGLQKLLARAEADDEIVVTKLDRLGRNTLDMITIIDGLRAKNVSVTFLDDNLTTKGDIGYMLITILSAVAQAERSRILERTNEGRKAALESGVKFGAKQKASTRAAIELIKAGGTPKDVMAKTGIARTSYYRLKKELAA